MIEIRALVTAGGYAAGRFYNVDDADPAVSGLIQAGYLLPINREEAFVGSGYPVEPRRLPNVGVDVGVAGPATPQKGPVNGASGHLQREDAADSAESGDTAGAEDGASDA